MRKRKSLFLAGLGLAASLYFACGKEEKCIEPPNSMAAVAIEWETNEEQKELKATISAFTENCVIKNYETHFKNDATEQNDTIQIPFESFETDTCFILDENNTTHHNLRNPEGTTATIVYPLEKGINVLNVTAMVGEIDETGHSRTAMSVFSYNPIHTGNPPSINLLEIESVSELEQKLDLLITTSDPDNDINEVLLSEYHESTGEATTQDIQDGSITATVDYLKGNNTYTVTVIDESDNIVEESISQFYGNASDLRALEIMVEELTERGYTTHPTLEEIEADYIFPYELYTATGAVRVDVYGENTSTRCDVGIDYKADEDAEKIEEHNNKFPGLPPYLTVIQEDTAYEVYAEFLEFIDANCPDTAQ